MKNGIMHILIIDDEPVVLLGLKRLLSFTGTRVQTAETYQSAMDLLKKKRFAVVIADLRLTGVQGEEGLEILKFIKQKRPQTKFMLITGYGSPEIKEKALKEGADRYFEKPVSPYVIQEALEEFGVEIKGG